MVAMKKPAHTRAAMMTAGVRLKNMTRKERKKPTPSVSSRALRETRPVRDAPAIRPRKMDSQSRLFIIWEWAALRMPMS